MADEEFDPIDVPTRARRVVRKMRRRADPRQRLLRALPRGSIGCEVGVWQGDFSVRLLEKVRPVELHLIDPWCYFADPVYADSWYGGAWARSQDDMDAIHDEVVARFAHDPRVTVHRQFSIEAAADFDAGSLGFAYIDGDHSFDAVRADLDAYADKIRPGGVLCGDDYSGAPAWCEDGVRRAVDAFLAGRDDFKPFLLDGQFALRRR